MLWKVVLKGDRPSGRILAVLYARTGDTIDVARKLLNSPRGMLLQSGLSKERADMLVDSLPDDGSVEILVLPDQDVCVPVLMGYRPGSRGRLRVALQKLSGLSTEEVIKFIGNIPIVLKSDSDRNTAEQIKIVLERSGGIVEIRAKENLDSVVSRKRRPSELSRTETRPQPVVKTNSGLTSTNQKNENKSIPNYIGVPPVVFSSDAPELSFEVIRPKLINFQPPEISYKIVPPIFIKKVDEIRFSTPYKINFTIPASQVPSIIPNNLNKFKEPLISESREAVLIYLYPVSKSRRDTVVRELESIFKYSKEKVLELIEKAPVPLVGFRERIDALVLLSELSQKGIPVSLISDTNGNPPPNQKSLLGWLNGHGRVT